MPEPTIIPSRLKELQRATIHAGHGSTLEEACAGELTDTPPCTDERLARLVHGINDGISDEAERTKKMRKLIPLVIGAAGQEEAVKALLDRLAVKRLRTIVLPHAETWPESIREEVVSAIEGVCDALEGQGDLAAAWSAAESAARSAASAARSAAWSAAESAAWSAASAAC